jgi:hypothetical protein
MSAPKSAAKRQRLERKRRRKDEAKRKRRRKQGGGPGFDSFDVLADLPRPVKMSDVLQNFLEPFLDEDTEDIEDHRRVFSIGMVAWNAALRPEPERQAMVDRLIREAMPREPAELQAVVRAMIDSLIERKERHFGHYRRPIVGFDLSELDDGGWFLNVASLVV